MFTPVLDAFTRNTRLAAVLAAASAYLAAYPNLNLQTRPPDGVLGILAALLPALEVGVLGGIVATAFDDDEPSLPRAAMRFVLWLATVLVIIWLVDAAMRAGIDAYVRFGAPPVFEAPV